MFLNKRHLFQCHHVSIVFNVAHIFGCICFIPDIGLHVVQKTHAIKGVLLINSLTQKGYKFSNPSSSATLQKMSFFWNKLYITLRMLLGRGGNILVYVRTLRSILVYSKNATLSFLNITIWKKC